MQLPRRHFLHLAAGAAALPAATRLATALDYPTRPVHLLEGLAKLASPRRLRDPGMGVCYYSCSPHRMQLDVVPAKAAA